VAQRTALDVPLAAAWGRNWFSADGANEIEAGWMFALSGAGRTSLAIHPKAREAPGVARRGPLISHLLIRVLPFPAGRHKALLVDQNACRRGNVQNDLSGCLLCGAECGGEVLSFGQAH
jgi:hypothetical protein